MTTTSRALVREVAPGISQIDLQFQGLEQVIAAYLLQGNGEAALIEVGPSSTRGALDAGMAAAGVCWDDMARLLVTHIHLDHAGAAGPIMRAHPRPRISVHPIGAPHLANPDKLIASATRIYGDQMESLWGDFAPIDPARIDEVEDGVAIDIAGRELIPYFTPGHASHHVAYLDRASGMLFTGDVAGVRIPGMAYVCPPTPPPDLDPEAWAESVRTMQALDVQHLALTHFGVFDDVKEHLAQILPNLDDFIGQGRSSLGPDGDTSDLTDALQRLEKSQIGAESPLFAQLELATPAYMAALGLKRLLKKRGEVG
jgi:glyoxylase-like metal-dependent hydrolase (beta-lactamase superfamily II)